LRHRVNVRLVLGEGDPDQKVFWDDAKEHIQAIALVKAFRTSPKIISATLLFQMEGLEEKTGMEILGRLAKKTGWLFVLKAEAIETDDGDEEPGDAEEDSETE
jgi:hypothetical protein